jgi:hypothetical protein
MNKKIVLSLASVLLLTACANEGTNETGPVDEEPEEAMTETLEAQETSEEEIEAAEVDEGRTHVFDHLITEKTFTAPEGYQGWEDYKIATDGVSLADFTMTNKENPNVNELDGDSAAELDERFEALGEREDVVRDEIEITERDKMAFHRYPPAADSEYNEVASFFSEITLYYVDDNLMFSAITPGYYSVELDDMLDLQELTSLLTISELEALEPSVYTVARMNIDGHQIEQIMTPAFAIDEDGNEMLMAFYLFIEGEDILQYAYLPFELVSQDFPTNAILVSQEMIAEFESL